MLRRWGQRVRNWAPIQRALLILAGVSFVVFVVLAFADQFSDSKKWLFVASEPTIRELAPSAEFIKYRDHRVLGIEHFDQSTDDIPHAVLGRPGAPYSDWAYVSNDQYEGYYDPKCRKLETGGVELEEFDRLEKENSLFLSEAILAPYTAEKWKIDEQKRKERSVRIEKLRDQITLKASRAPGLQWSKCTRAFFQRYVVVGEHPTLVVDWPSLRSVLALSFCILLMLGIALYRHIIRLCEWIRLGR